MTYPQVTAVRKETDAELAELAAFAGPIFRSYFVDEQGIISAEQAEQMISMMLSADALARERDEEGYEAYMFLDADGQPVSFALIKPDGGEGGDMFLSKLYVRRESRGGGYGKAMLAFLSDLAAERGWKSMWLTCNKDNAASLAFYDRMGFSVFDSVCTDIGNGFVMDDHFLRVSCPMAVFE